MPEIISVEDELRDDEVLAEKRSGHDTEPDAEQKQNIFNLFYFGNYDMLNVTVLSKDY